METRRSRAGPARLVGAFGAVLFVVALVHHAREIGALDEVVAPLIALLLDGGLALVLVYAGYRLSRSDLSPEGRRLALGWSLLGAALFVAIMGVSILVRAYEGRVVGEWLFPLLIAAEAGGIAGVIAGYHTARARAEARRTRTVSEALGFVNSLIRHDLRNDLSVIEGYAELLEGGDDDGSGPAADSAAVIGEKADEALARIETTGVVAETLVGDVELDRVDLAAVTAEIAKQVEATHDVTVETTLADDAAVRANRGLRSVVDNLLENAVEHNDAETPRVDVSVDTAGERARLAVADNGPGLSAAEKEDVLTPRSEAGGSGGLSLVRTLVDGYGGDVWIEDNEPRGTVFVVELPRADEG